MRLHGLLCIPLLASAVVAFHGSYQLRTTRVPAARAVRLFAKQEGAQTAAAQAQSSGVLKGFNVLWRKREAPEPVALQTASGTETKSFFARALSVLKHPRTALTMGAGASLAAGKRTSLESSKPASSYFYHRWTRPLELEGVLEAMALDLLTAMGLGLDTVGKVVETYQQSFPDNNALKLVTFLKEWASTTSEPNIYDVAVVHLITNSMLRLSDDEKEEVIHAITRELRPKHQIPALWVVAKTWQENERPAPLKQLLADPNVVADFERLDKLAYKQCVRAWVADVLSTRLSKQRVNAVKPPAGYEELGMDIKHAILQFGDYLQQIVERRSRQNDSGRKLVESIWSRYEETKRSPSKTLHDRSKEEYEEDLARILEVLQRDTGNRAIRPLSGRLARLLSTVRFPIVDDLQRARVVPANPANVCRECGLVMFVAKGRESRFVGSGNTCPRCGAPNSFEKRDVSEI